LEYERNAVLAVSSIYGIDLLEDNVHECRKRLFNIFDQKYAALFKDTAKDKCRCAVGYILKRNIIIGDALALKTIGDEPEQIVFSEWSLVRGSMIKRRDFAFRELISDKERQMSLFSAPRSRQRSDLGKDVFIPEPVKEYPLTHFLEVVNGYE